MPGQARTCLTYLRALLAPPVPRSFSPLDRGGIGHFLLEYSARKVELETVQVRDVQYSDMVSALAHRGVLCSTAVDEVAPATVEFSSPHPGSGSQ
jgi:hypothetical protein